MTRAGPAEVLYRGDDLDEAAARSRLSRARLGALAGAYNAAAVLGDVVRGRLAERARHGIEIVEARGAASAGGAETSAVYAGTGANLAWTLGALFPGGFSETSRRRLAPGADPGAVLRRVAEGASFVVTDGLGSGALAAAGLAFLRVPAWVRQRLRVEAEWSAQLAAMRRGTRRETARILRKHGYEAALREPGADVRDFYERLYRPHVAERFGAAGIVVDPARFARECRRGRILELRAAGELKAAALLRRLGNRLAIVWSAPAPGVDASAGAADAMDYFSLLCAHLAGCRWLDFGTTRPDLADGVLRYKRKWGAAVTRSLVPQATVGFACTGRHPDEHAFLRRHVFLSRRGSGLEAHVFVDGATPLERLGALLEDLRTPGVAAYRVAGLPPVAGGFRDACRALGPDVTCAEAPLPAVTSP